MYTYIINLKSRVDRYKHIVNEVRKIPTLQYQVVDAIYDSNGAIGCFKSHKKCIQLAKNNNLQHVLILEDDAVFSNNANSILDICMQELKHTKFDMLYLGANLQSVATKFTDHTLKLTAAYTTHAYIINHSLYDIILSSEITKPIDVLYYELMSHYNVLMCDPIIAYQLPSHSDIELGYKDYNEHIRNNYLRFKI